jgi:NAD(P)-dependent dehydrogenase (short-subunit alcohol dehydrogenase family)
MELQDQVVVVTGGGNGIGRAMAKRFAAEGAAGVVVADLDTDAAVGVATEVTEAGGAAFALPCDVADEEQVVGLLDLAEERFGPIDLFCANAGVAVGTDEQTSDEDWALAWDVNLRAHVLAARHLVPRWLERGSGYFLSTASAAGLLTQIGSAPYSVTKHAAVAFAEWLAIAYGDRGIGVSCLCPMGVSTAMLTAGEDTGIAPLATRAVRAAGAVLEPDEVAAAVVEALAEERFLVLPHPEVGEFWRRKTADYDRWLGGMRRLARQVEDPA